jgi:mannitol-1-phosphate/altronate dehydrogenase
MCLLLVLMHPTLLGVGAFHRSHQAMYIDQLMNAGQAMDWGMRARK